MSTLWRFHRVSAAAIVAIALSCDDPTEVLSHENPVCRVDRGQPAERPMRQMGVNIPEFSGYHLEDGKVILSLTDVTRAADARAAFHTMVDDLLPRGTEFTSVEIRVASVVSLKSLA